jgi:hypothetical protein
MLAKIFSFKQLNWLLSGLTACVVFAGLDNFTAQAHTMPAFHHTSKSQHKSKSDNGGGCTKDMSPQVCRAVRLADYCTKNNNQNALKPICRRYTFAAVDGRDIDTHLNYPTGSWLKIGNDRIYFSTINSYLNKDPKRYNFYKRLAICHKMDHTKFVGGCAMFGSIFHIDPKKVSLHLSPN